MSLKSYLRAFGKAAARNALPNSTPITYSSVTTEESFSATSAPAALSFSHTSVNPEFVLCGGAA